MMLAFIVGLCISTLPVVQNAKAQVLDLLPIPATWATASGSYFRINADAKPEVKPSGSATNYYIGSTTNVALTNALTLQVVNGIITGVIAEE